jgi:hypothetical protein
MKKWNVSCDTYGLRWKVEDVVGVLVDMDLLEMKFFLNGVDLGPAFSNFSFNGLYPAISLNVRQCLRVNFGQEKFIYPPTVVDGLPFRPVIDALKLTKENEKKKPPLPESALPEPLRALAKAEDSKLENRSPTFPSEVPSQSIIAPNLFAADGNTPQDPHGGGGSRVGGVRLGRTAGEIPIAEDRNPIERVITVDSSVEDDPLQMTASRRAAGEEGENNEVWREMSRRALRRGSRGNSAPGTRNASQPTSAAAMFLTPSVPNLEGQGIEANETKDLEENEILSADGEEEGDGDGEDDGDGEGGMTDVGNASLFSGHSAPNPGLEARRQLLIENLIGMVCYLFFLASV